jgi:SAM-dependent methyltransferase
LPEFPVANHSFVGDMIAAQTKESTEAAQRDPKVRFAWGRNWQRFLKVINEDRIDEAVLSLRNMLDVERLDGLKFIDVCCGSGLFSLAARRLGAQVFSFDFDPGCVQCAKTLREKYDPDDSNWQITQGSALDEQFVKGLGQFDIVYAWGGLHHTGGMWKGIDLATSLVGPEGKLYLAIYDDQGFQSRIWYWIKYGYCHSVILRLMLIPFFFTLFFVCGLGIDLVHLRNPIARYTDHRKYRGMSLVHDWLDWLGGYPYEYATADALTDFVAERGFRLLKREPPPIGFGNNQLVYQHVPDEKASQEVSQ